MLTIRPIPAADVRQLRRDILRPHQSLDEMLWQHDTDPETIHFGAFVDDELSGIGTIYPAPFPNDPEMQDTWQLRGMATKPEVRGMGCAKAIVLAAEAEVRSKGGRAIWFNARTPAIGFYEKLGYQRVGEEFQQPNAGPHYRMFKLL